MNKIVKLLALLLALSVVFTACGGGGGGASQTGSTINNGLVAYYPFTGNANDASGNGNNGTISGAVLTADRNGNASNAYDTMAGYIEVPDAASLDVADFTVTAWLRGDDFSHSFGVLVGKDYLTSFAIGIDSGGSTVCPAPAGVHRYMTVYIGNVGHYFATPDFTCNTWYHVAVTYNNATGVSELFVNAVSQGTITFASGGNNPNSSPMGVGKDGSHSDSFHGAIDEVRIYNRVLSAAEVQAIYAL